MGEACLLHFLFQIYCVNNLFFKGQMESKIRDANGMIDEIMFVSVGGNE